MKRVALFISYFKSASIMIGFIQLNSLGNKEKVLAQRSFVFNCCLKKCFQILCILAYPKIWQWIACLSRNIKVEGLETCQRLTSKIYTSGKVFMCFSIGDFAYVLYVLPGQVSKFDILCAVQNWRYLFSFTNW